MSEASALRATHPENTASFFELSEDHRGTLLGLQLAHLIPTFGLSWLNTWLRDILQPTESWGLLMIDLGINFTSGLSWTLMVGSASLIYLRLTAAHQEGLPLHSQS